MHKIKFFSSCILLAISIQTVFAEEAKPKNNNSNTNTQAAQTTHNEQWRSRYYYVSPFILGRAYVYEGGKYAYVNESGELLTPLIYDYVTIFTDGIAKVFIGEKTGVIDANGNEVVPCIYEDIETVNTMLFTVKKENKWYLFDAETQKYISEGYRSIYVLNEWLFRVLNYEDWEGKYYILNRAGEKISNNHYSMVYNSSGSFAVVQNAMKYSVIDSLGRQQLPFTDMVLENLVDGFFSSGKDFFVLRHSKLVKLKVETLEKISNGFYLVTRKKLKGIVNHKGETIIPSKYNYISQQPNDLFIVAVKQKYGVYNAKGKMVCKLQYDMIEDYSDGLALVRKDGAFGYIDTFGELKIPIQRRKSFSFSEGLAVVQQKGLYGYINVNNEVVILNKYSKAESFENGEAKVREGKREFTIDRSGNEKESIHKQEALKDDNNGLTKMQADITELLDRPSSRFMNDSLLNVGGYRLTYSRILTMHIDSLHSITTEEEFVFWTNYVIISEHNYIRFCHSELEATIYKREGRQRNLVLTQNDKLVKSAYLHSKDMCEHNYSSHTGLNGSHSYQRILAQNYNPTTCGENIAHLQKNIKIVICDWVSSSGHFSNIVYEGFNEMGLGVYNLYWTVNFGNECKD